MHGRAVDAMSPTCPRLADKSGPVPFSSGTRRPALKLPAGACDCHVHFYDDVWPVTEGASLTPPTASADDHRRLQQRLGTTRVVLVTPSTYGIDNGCMLEGLAQFGSQARGVAVLSGNEPAEEIARLHAAGVRGVRFNLSLGGGAGLSSIERIVSLIEPHGWHAQVLMPPDLLVQHRTLLHDLPVPVVFDHFGRLPARRPFHVAHTVILDLFARGTAWVKLSGAYLLTEDGSIESPILDDLAESYLASRPDRIVWGSDWPHATASAGRSPMPDDARQVERLAEWAGSAMTLHRILVDNPESLYGFDPHARQEPRT